MRRDILRRGDQITPVPIIGLNDFHGQLEPTTTTIDGATNVSVGGAGQLATLFDEEDAALPGQSLLLSGGDNVGASPPNSGLLDDRPAIDVMNAWGTDASAVGNHEFDYGLPRLLDHIARADWPYLSANIVDEDTGETPDWLDASTVVRVNGVRVGVIGATVKTTKELVKPENTEGLAFLDEAERIEAESRRLRRQGVRVQVVVIHEGAATGGIAPARLPRPHGGARSSASSRSCRTRRSTSSSPAIRIARRTPSSATSRSSRASTPATSYSVAQLMVKGGDVAWAGTATRTAKNLGVTPRQDVQAIVDTANADTLEERTRVIGTQVGDILRAPDRLAESAMGNLVADAMLAAFPDAEAALTNAGGLRQNLPFAPSPAGEQPGEITWGEAFGVLPFGNYTVLETLTGAQLRAALLNGLSAACNPPPSRPGASRWSRGSRSGTTARAPPR